MLEIMTILGLSMWIIFGVFLVISSIQTLIYDIRREKRDIEYHKAKMKNLI